jgi:hypothetical protein
MLLLDQDVGLFVDFNSDGVNTAVHDLRDAIVRDFLDRYYPAPVPIEPTVATAAQHAAMVAGSYEASRRLNGVLAVFMMFNQVAVTANSDGTITIPTPPTGERKTYHEIGPFLWREVGGKELLEARVKDGRVVSLHNHPVGVFIKVPSWKSSTLNLPLLAASFLILVATLVGWPVAALVRRHYSITRTLIPEQKVSWHWARLGVGAMLLFLLGWVLLTTNLLSHFYLFNAGLDPWLRVLHLIGLAGIAGTVAALWHLRTVFRTPAGRGTRFWSVVLASAMLWLTWFTFAFNLITATLDY